MKQLAALQEAGKDKIFQLPESRRHSPNVLALLVKAGLLKAEKVGVVWTITDAGRAELSKAPSAQGVAVSIKAAVPQLCPTCSSEAKIVGSGRRWQVVCSRNTQTILSPCQVAGHVMFTKTEAVRVWNEMQ